MKRGKGFENMNTRNKRERERNKRQNERNKFLQGVSLEDIRHEAQG